MYNTTYRTYKEINSRHDMVCIESIIGIELVHSSGFYYLHIYLAGNSYYFSSDNFDTEEEALEFRNKLLSNELEVK